MAELKDGECEIELWIGNSIIGRIITRWYVDMPDILQVNKSFYIRGHQRYDSGRRYNYIRANEIQSVESKLVV